MEKENILKQLKIEEFIWIIYLVIIGLSFYSNYIERKYIIFDDNQSKNKYRTLNIIIFTIAVIVYLYFTYSGYQDLTSLNSDDSENKKNFTYLSFIASLFTLISGLLFLYISIYDTNVDIEIAFN